MSAAFQINAFQNNAFQVSSTSSSTGTVIVTGSPSNDIYLCKVPAFANISDVRLEDPTKKCGGTVGWPFRHDPRKLPRKYGEEERRQRLEELIAEANKEAAEAKNKARRKAIKEAVAESKLVREVDTSLLMALEAAVAAKRGTEQIEAARHAVMIARARYEYEMEQDEEESLVLLLT